MTVIERISHFVEQLKTIKGDLEKSIELHNVAIESAVSLKMNSEELDLFRINDIARDLIEEKNTREKKLRSATNGIAIAYALDRGVNDLNDLKEEFRNADEKFELDHARIKMEIKKLSDELVILKVHFTLILSSLDLI